MRNWVAPNRLGCGNSPTEEPSASLQIHGSIQLYHKAIKLESQLGFELVATQRPFMHHPNRKPLHDVLTCILHKTNLEKAKTKLTSNSERHLKTLEEIHELWKDRPDLLHRSFEIAIQNVDDQ